MSAYEGGDKGVAAINYRMFRLDERGRVQAAAVVIEAADDKTAVKRAEELASGSEAELWQGTRLVLRIGKKLKGQFAQQEMGGLLAMG